jgi:hypothetical protein
LFSIADWHESKNTMICSWWIVRSRDERTLSRAYPVAASLLIEGLELSALGAIDVARTHVARLPLEFAALNDLITA